MKKNSTNPTPNRGPGRPKSTNPKLDGLRVRLTLDELHAVNQAAGNMTISEWARRALLKAARRARSAKAIPQQVQATPKPAGTI